MKGRRGSVASQPVEAVGTKGWRMGACYGFEVTTDDVASVLMRMGRGGDSPMEKAEEVMGSLDMEAVERAALDASTDLCEQTDAALDEVERQIRQTQQ